MVCVVPGVEGAFDVAVFVPEGATEDVADVPAGPGVSTPTNLTTA